MDHNKQPHTEPLSSPTSLKMVYAPSPYGRVCVKKEVLCLRCWQRGIFTLPDYYLTGVDSEDAVGDVMINDIAEQAGWVVRVQPRQGASGEDVYMLCPDCIQSDITVFHRVANRLSLSRR